MMAWCRMIIKWGTLPKVVEEEKGKGKLLADILACLLDLSLVE